MNYLLLEMHELIAFLNFITDSAKFTFNDMVCDSLYDVMIEVNRKPHKTQYRVNFIDGIFEILEHYEK